MMRCLELGWLSTLLAACVGCGGGANLPDTVPVSGKVALNGKPLTNASVTFIPAGITRGEGGFGTTDQEGRYELTYLRGSSGVPVGEYRVVINKRVMPDGSDADEGPDVAPIESQARELLHPKYSNEQHTTLSATVPEGGGSVDFNLSTDK